jgi:hypothetical protein
MCEFLSLVRVGKKDYFLTKQQMDSPQGQALKLRFPGEGELIGHSAIRAYYEIDGGKDIEITDFSTPDKFPLAVVRAIKGGNFRGAAQPEGLLTPAAEKQFWAVVDPAEKQFWAVKDTAWKRYRAVVDAAFWDLFADNKNRAEGLCIKSRYSEALLEQLALLYQKSKKRLPLPILQCFG